MARRNLGKLKKLLSMNDLSDDMIFGLIHRAIEYKNGATYQFLEPKFVANLFYEDNTKSHYGFEMAQHRLGLKVLSFDPKSSSAYKGESIYDAGMTMSVLGVNVIVAAAKQERYYTKWMNNPIFNSIIINAGDGDNEDPTHALTDLMTIYEHFNYFKGLKVGFIGDSLHSRVTKSTVQALKRFGAEIFFSGPEHLQSPYCALMGDFVPIDEMLPLVDVVMVLRVQSERYDYEQNFSEYYQKYGITEERFAKAKDSMIILHPGPIKRDVEIADEVSECERSKILVQAQNSVYMNMAILEAALS